MTVLQRAAGWCEAVRVQIGYPLGAVYRTSVGYTGCARYCAYECRETGTRVVPQRFVTPLSLDGDKGVYFLDYIWR